MSPQYDPRNDPAAERPTFDEQLWPVNVALLFLGGLVAGGIIATSSFDDPHLLANGYVRLGSLAVALIGLMWAATLLGNRAFRRALQFAALVSILVHMALMFALWANREAGQTPQAKAKPEPEPEMIVSMDYAPEAIEDPNGAREFDAPIDVATSERSPEAASREQPAATEAPKAAQPAAAPLAPQAALPSSVKKAERREAAPRRGNPSKLSRRVAEAKINPDNPSPNLPPLKSEDEPATVVAPRDTALARNAAAPPAPRPTGPAAADIASHPRATLAPARRDVPDRAADLPSIAMATRRSNEPRALPRAEEPAPLPELAPSAGQTLREESPSGPAAEKLARSATAGPHGGARAEGSGAQRTVAPVLTAPGARAAESATPLVASTAGATSRAVKTPVLADSAAADQPTGAAPAAVAQQEAAPVATTVARTRSDLSGKAPLAAELPREVAALPRIVAQSQPQRGLAAEAPTLNPAGRPTDRPARSTKPADVENSALAIDNPTPGAPGAGAKDAGSPSTTALAKSDAATPAAAQGKSGAPSPAGDGQPDSAPRSDQRSGPLGASEGAPRAGGGGGSDRGGSTVVARSPGRSGGRSAGGGGPLVTLAADVQSDLARAPPGEGGGAPGATLQAVDDPAGATRSGSSEALPLGGMAIEAPPGPTGGLGVGSATISRPAGTLDAGPGGGTAGAGPGAGGPGGGEARQSSGRGVGGAAGSIALGRGSASGPAIDARADLAAGAGAGTNGAGESGSSGGDRLAPQADTLAGRTGAGGRGDGAGATTLGPARRAAGIPGDLNSGPGGFAAGESVIDGARRSGPGNGMNPERVDAAGDPSVPRVGSIATNGGPGRRNLAGPLGSVPGAADDVPDDQTPGGGRPESQTMGPGGLGREAGGGLAEAGQRTAAGVVGRRPGGMPVDVAAPAGVGGLAAVLAPDVGSLDRRARRDSEIIHPGAGRFLGRKTGEALSVDGRAREPARAYARRGGTRRGGGGGLPQPTQRTEDAVELGLDFLARHQMPQGNWNLHRFGAGRPGYEAEGSQIRSDTAATGLALLAFLGAGYDHYDDQYQNAVRAGLEFLVNHQKPNGDLYIAEDAESGKSAWLYSHGIATIALCEAYGMTGDEHLRDPAQRAIDFIVSAQHPTRGGWRYQPQYDSDTSVSGWQLMALKSGELAGLAVPARTYDLARHWLDGAEYGPDHAEYVYNPFAPNTDLQRHGRQPTATMTAVGLLMRLYLGRNREDPLMQGGAAELRRRLPTLGTRQQPQGDTYYWYYATQVMFHMKGDYWKAWNERLHPLLVDMQIQSGPLAGSWDPTQDRWGKAAGRIYVTTMNLLSLEVYYRHLPIYESEAR